MSVLEEICAKKAKHVALKKQHTPLEQLKKQLKDAPTPKGFISAVKNKQTPAIITEVKKASPSKGIIREDFNPVDIAKIYEENGATCISVLTDEPYFQGHDDYLKAIRKDVHLPLLRKDFIIDPYQVYETRTLGADCVLLIMAALSDTQAKELYTLSTDLGMDVLVEIHNEEELDRALKLDPAMIGINNRNLKTLEVNIQTSFELLEKLPKHIIKIAESGISKAKTIQDLHSAGYNGFLVGESLMRQPCIATALQNLLS